MKNFKIYFAAFVALIAAVAFNSVAGATISTVLGGSALTGAVAGNVVSLVAGSFLPKGAAYEGVFTEIWTGKMIKAFRTAAESLGWYDRIRSYDQYVDNDVIHFTEHFRCIIERFRRICIVARIPFIISTGGKDTSRHTEREK